MKIIDLKNFIEVECIPQGSVIAFGLFDGVHIGHRALIDTAKRLAEGSPTAVWTFEAMPKLESGSVLTTNSEKCDLLADCGADYVIFEDFDRVRELAGRDFFKNLICKKYSPSAVVCGFNFRFGKSAAHDAADLSAYAAEHGVHCTVVPEVKIDGITVSSSAIREKLRAGDMLGAAEVLGRPYSVTAAVCSGRRIGRTVGRPTANLRFEGGKLIPPYGVYSCTVDFEDDGRTVRKFGVCNIGARPTVNSDTSDITLETYIFDHAGELYGKKITVSLVELLRCERKFDSIAELTRQISKDEEKARKSLAEHGFMI